MKLRPYQQEAMDAILGEWDRGIKKTLLVLPTGTGKTIVFSKVIEARVAAGDRVLVLAHRGELLDQAADKLHQATGLQCAVEKAEHTSINSWYRVVVGSVQTLTREKRLNQFEKNHFDMIVIDEAHHSISDSYQNVIDYFEDAKVLGVTATPDRGDMRDLGEIYETLAYEYTLPKAIKSGYLTKIQALTLPLSLDLSKIGNSNGDFKVNELGTALDPYLDQIADAMVEHCMNRKTVVFLPLIATSQKFTALLNEKGFKAAEVNGESFDREEILKDFENNEYNVLCNSMLLTEGWDSPEVDCIVVLRPTRVRSLYSQMVGRGTRLSPGKNNLLLLDFLWHTEKHELCHPAHLISNNDKVAMKMTELIEKETQDGEAIDIELLEAQAISDIQDEREEALAEELAKMRKRKMKLVDPLQFEMSIQDEDLASYVPSFGWEMGPPSDSQTEYLVNMGIMPDSIENAGKASLMIERLNARRKEGLSTPKQIRFLEQRGYKKVGMWEFEEAQKMIGAIANNGWRPLRGITPATFKPESLMGVSK